MSQASRRRCPICDEQVLAAPTLGGMTLLMDVEEIVPRMPCPVCRPRGVDASPRQRDYSLMCWRCEDRGWIGEDHAGLLAVGVDDDGIARPYLLGRRPRLREESLHRAHVCVAVPSVA